MSEGIREFAVILIGNLCIAAVYLIWNLIRGKEKRSSAVMKTIVMLICPLIGPLFLLLAYLFYQIFSAQGMDLSDVVFSKERTKQFVHPDEEMEKNMVSLEEALAVTDKKNLRTLMLNVIRGDYRNSLSSITLALNSEDSETAHYAASVLQDVLNDFRKGVQERYLLCQIEDEQQLEHCIDLIEYMNPILEQEVLTTLEQGSMTEKMREALDTAWHLNPQKISSTVYTKVCERMLQLHEYDACTVWCERAAEQYPKALSSYTCQLKLYFSCGEREKFFRVMDALRNSDITIDNETLEMIRTFL